MERSASSTGDTTISGSLAGSARGRPEPAPTGLEPGSLVDGVYRVEDLVGAGAMGVVYRARDVELDRSVALKLQRGRDERALARLLREARAMAKLAHPNVITIHAVGLVDAQVYIAMEFVEGGTLRAWLTEPRSVDEILEVFGQAAAGLAAAHAQGLVHRDFKPDNVLVGRDGRVRVADFGLARGDDRDEPRPSLMTSQRLAQLQSATGSELDLNLTAPGAMAGTPAYMAPEQYWGGRVDARADQFSFCVALYEALYGEHPFGGHTPSELLSRIMDGEIRPAPAKSRVPARLRAPLLRGLAADPERRHPSMRALVSRLRLDRGRTRRSLGIGAIALVALGLGATASAWWLRPEAPADPCASTSAGIDDLWSATRRATLEASFMSSGSRFAAPQWRRFSSALDAWGEAWATQREDACRATRVTGEASDLMLERRNACLDRSLGELRALLTALEAPDAATVDQASRALEKLAPLHRCADPDYLAAELEPPPADKADEVARLREALADAEARSRLGDYDNAMRLATDALERAERLGYRELIAEAREVMGREIDRARGTTAEAEQTLEDAYFLAREQNHHEVAGRAALHLGFLVGYESQRYAEGRRWLRQARTEFKLRGALDDHETALLVYDGAIAAAEGYPTRAREAYERALEIQQKLSPDDDLRLAHMHVQVATALDEEGRFEDARGHYEVGLRVIEREFGSDHPDLILLHGNLALNAADRADYERAVSHARRSLEIAIATHGEEHDDVGLAHLNLGVVLQNSGDEDGAAAEFTRAIEIIRATRGEKDPTVALCLSNLGTVEGARGNLERSLELHREASAIAREVQGSEHPDYALYRYHVGSILFEQGKYPEARDELEGTCPVFDASLGEGHWRGADCRRLLGQTLRELGRVDDALLLLEASLKLLEGNGGPAFQLADARFAVATTLRQLDRNPKRVRELLERALGFYVDAGAEERVALVRSELDGLD